jgi:uncharacterized protein
MEMGLMQQLMIGLGLFFVLEGLLYALFPGGIKNMARYLPEIPDAKLRNFGAISIALGVALIWLIKN